ncbi:HEAT repeat domain-containing protein [Microcoleus sp. LEGE 07076]|uniref:HEAT repeat domain-containing protein n=1 Tax=Microcoleus sp. LEGE 07076 TaxID=915322 RepID=UPI001880B862|nr:HEAT repeat domain-containing protein [Microcoleus sp. LEGE 07076]MBE9186591.1 HEAT repeat domain-containing protein [Microcoleus sp. LEGE 07076]
MIIEIGTLGLKLAQAIGPKLAEIGFKEAIKKFNPSDFEKAWTCGIKTANKTHELFYPCEQGLVENFIEKKFFIGAALPELLKPFNNQGTPQVELLVAAFNATVAENKRIQDRFIPEKVRDWLDVFARTYFEKTNCYLSFQVAKADYFKQVANWFDDVKFAGIAVEGQEIEKSEKLAQIFVMPDVLEDVNTLVRLDIEELEAGKNLQLLQRESRSGRKFLASQLLNQNRSHKFVLLGAPGSGKTTLLSFFAVMLAQNYPEKLGWDAERDCLPILIKIRDFARLSDISLLDYARQFAEKTMSVKRLPEGFFEYWLADGRAMILLDGLDEVVEESKRYAVVQQIENFLGQYHQNLAIITSRPAGYKRDFFNSSEFEHYQLQLLDNAKVDEFIDHWYDSRVRDPAEAQRRKESIKKALNENDRIKLLARNPLLLTIIALIHRYQAVLPRARHKLYEKAVETLLKCWDANKKITEQSSFKCLDEDDLRRLMEILAYWIHTQGSTDNPEGGTLIAKDDLFEQLTQNIKTKKLVERFQAREEARRFVDFIQQRTGLLNEQGQDLYAFVHKTFQEYLCAQEIAYQADDDGDFEIILNHIREHLHDPHWREVLLLLIAQQKPKKAAKAIRAILAANSEYEEWLHRDLFFAGSCLAENIKELKVVDSSLTVEILEKLVELEVRGEALVGDRVRSQVLQILCSMNETEFEAQTLQLLKARGVDENRLWRYQAELGEKEAAISALLLRLENGDEDVRMSAAQALGRLGNASEIVISALLLRLKDEDSMVRREVVQALGGLGNASETVIGFLVLCLQDEKQMVRHEAARALGRLGNASEIVINSLLLSLQDAEHSVHFFAVRGLSRFGHVSEALVSALLLRLEDGDKSVRVMAAQALGNLGNASETVISTLLQSLQDGDKLVRCKAVQALGNLGNTSESVISALLQSLEDGDEDIRRSAVYALINLGNASETVINAVLLHLADGHKSVRMMAAQALGNLGNTSEAVISALLLSLQDGEDRVRMMAAQALGNLGNTSEAVISALLLSLEDGEDRMRMMASEALGNLGNTSEAVISALLLSLEHEHEWVRSSAVQALGNLGNTSEAVISALLLRLEDGEDWVRRQAAFALGKLGLKSSDVLPAVVQWIDRPQDTQDTPYVGSGIDVLWDLAAS